MSMSMALTRLITCNMIKGGGAALTREKIVASASDEFVCIADRSKLVDQLGAFPLPVEVIPMARSLVARALVFLGGHPIWREGVTTDNGNIILDVHGFAIDQLSILSGKSTISPASSATAFSPNRPPMSRFWQAIAASLS